MIIQVNDRPIELDDRLRFATKVMIQQTIIEKMSLVADTPETLDTMTESDDVFQLFDIGDWYKILSLQCKTKIDADEFYQFADEDIDTLKKKWNLLTVSAGMRSEFIKNYAIRIKSSLDSLLKIHQKAQAD
jgi:hypothetical protein